MRSHVKVLVPRFPPWLASSLRVRPAPSVIGLAYYGVTKFEGAYQEGLPPKKDY